MKEDARSSIEKRMQHIPDGRMEMVPHYTNRHAHGLFHQANRTIIDGKGMVEDFHLFRGLHLSHYHFLSHGLQDQHPASDHIIEINHCRYGRLGWRMRDKRSVYLGPGDMDIHTAYCCADSVMEFPLGYYEGIAVSIDLNRFSEELPQLLRDAEFSRQQLFDDFCAPGAPLMLASGSALDHMLEPLYRIPESIRLPYYQLKALEMLLMLSAWKPGQTTEKQLHYVGKTEQMKEVHAFLTGNLRERPTVSELSRRFHINPTSLKDDFKIVYGAPIAGYMKEYRIREAIRLMKAGESSLAEIARRVGYTSQSKFTRAFKDITQTLPAAYRKELQENTD